MHLFLVLEFYKQYESDDYGHWEYKELIRHRIVNGTKSPAGYFLC